MKNPGREKKNSLPGIFSLFRFIKEKVMKKVVEVFTYSEFVSGPEVAVVEINEDLANRIRQLVEAAKSLGVFKIMEFNDAPAFFLRDYDAEEKDGRIAFREPSDEDEVYSCRVECVALNVTSIDFYWSGFIRNTDVRLETGVIPVSELGRGAGGFPREAIRPCAGSNRSGPGGQC